ncbi:ATP-sensitive inward rectifier potassium channel 8-like isoform X3 [Zootermopsis nevadensis]|uniref:ATP-sensitive inward rectifier potassium channel 8-like isoform X3 n=1 Tax=Zootermopsis nevadensis TaxID=136037 RepID=UPI000B8E8E4D|nr:ATP-sensitive inward rectifier potassium channel 8-like isoform X3 [Zootermopsis nevadensis]
MQNRENTEMVQYIGVSVTEDNPLVQAKRQHHRAVLKNGVCNLYPSHVAQHKWRFIQDSVTTLVDMRWRYALFICTFTFFFSWTAFAVLWWLIAYAHGDFEERHQNSSDWTPCVTQLYNFTSCFLFSMENQHTTGFGARMPTEECPEAIFLMCMQGIVGVILQSIMVGLVFLKMVRPKQRTRTLEFSNNAVICRRNGKLCLMFRVGDLRRSHIIEAKMRVLLVQTWTTPEGEVISPSRTELRVEDTSDVKSNFFCLLWPETVVHCIDKSSLLYELSANDLREANFEIVVIMEGTIESTDQRVQARTSYLPAEILWGHRFEPVVSYDKSQGRYDVDYNRFHCTEPVETPRVSAREQYNNSKVPITCNEVAC